MLEENLYRKYSEYLQENLTGNNIVFEQLDNGGYYVRNWDGNAPYSMNELYIPPNLFLNCTNCYSLREILLNVREKNEYRRNRNNTHCIS